MLFGNKKESHVIVIGGCRNFKNYDFFKKTLDCYLQAEKKNPITILSGHCSGVDQMAERYAKEKGIKLMLFPAEWNKYGRAAGPIRNEEVVKLADTVIAFWDGQSKGTKNLISLAKQYNKILNIIYL